MARSQGLAGVEDPLSRLALQPFCEHPDVKGLTYEQKLALHEFFHSILVAGYRLYQVVPEELARPIVKKKLGMMAAGSSGTSTDGH